MTDRALLILETAINGLMDNPTAKAAVVPEFVWGNVNGLGAEDVAELSEMGYGYKWSKPGRVLYHEITIEKEITI